MSTVTLPLTLRAGKLKTSMLLLGSLTFVVGGWWLSGNYPAIGYGNMAFFGLCSVVALVMLYPKAHYLVLRTDGFEFCTLFRKHVVPWKDVVCFKVVSIGMNSLVGWNYAKSYTASPKVRAANQAIAKIDAALPDTYSMKDAELASLMETIRVECGGAIA